MKRKSFWQRVFAVLLIAATGWYLISAIAGNWQELRTFDWNVDPFYLVISVIAHVAVLGWGVFVWGRVLRSFEHPPVPFPALLRIWFLSNLARYVPGKVWQFLAVAQLGRNVGLSGAILLTSLLVHTALSLLAAMILGVFAIGGDLFLGFPALVIAGAATAIALGLVHPTVLNTAIGIVPRLLRREVVSWKGSWWRGVGLLWLSLLSWIFYGAAFSLFVASLARIPVAAVPALSGINALSFVIGYLAIITPAGMGVREVAMANLLLPLLPGGVAAVLAVASRMWTVAAELIGGGTALLLSRRSGPVPDSAVT